MLIIILVNNKNKSETFTENLITRNFNLYFIEKKKKIVSAISTMSSKSTSKNYAHYSHLQSTSTSSSYSMGSYLNNKNAYDGIIRKSPEGKDNDSYHIEDKRMILSGISNNSNYINQNGGHSLNSINSNENKLNSTNSVQNDNQKNSNDVSAEIFSTSNDNGKINVQVTVLVGEFNIFRNK